MNALAAMQLEYFAATGLGVVGDGIDDGSEATENND